MRARPSARLSARAPPPSILSALTFRRWPVEKFAASNVDPTQRVSLRSDSEPDVEERELTVVRGFCVFLRLRVAVGYFKGGLNYIWYFKIGCITYLANKNVDGYCNDFTDYYC